MIEKKFKDCEANVSVFVLLLLELPENEVPLYELAGTHPTDDISLCYVFSEYVFLWGSISETLKVIACFFLHLQEGSALWKLYMSTKAHYVK